MHFADGVTEATAMKDPIYQRINASTPRDLRPFISPRPIISPRLAREPIAFNTLTFLHIAPCAGQSMSLQAARGDDEFMSMDPNLTQA